MSRSVRLAGAAAISVLLHGLLLLWTVEWPEPGRPPPVLDLVLDPEPDATVEIEPTEPAIKPVDDEATVVEPDPYAELVEEPPPEAELAEIPFDSEPMTDEPVANPLAPLDLSRPAEWDALVSELPEPDVLRFNESLREGVRERQSVKRRQALIAERVAAVYGVPDELYTREGPLGTEIKIDGKCYLLSNQPSIEEGTRWSMQQCTDTRTNPFLLAPIEFDALGHVIAD